MDRVVIIKKHYNVGRFLKLSILNLSLLLLVGCTPESIFLSSMVGHTLLTEPRSMQNIASDVRITHQIEKKLSRDAQFMAGTQVVVASYNRVVLLTGQTPYKFLRDRAEMYAKSAKDVQRVFNQIKIQEPNSLKLRMQDGVLAVWIRCKLMFTNRIRSNHFKVIVEDQEAFLIGKAKKEESKLATLVLQNTKGIKRVIRMVEPD